VVRHRIGDRLRYAGLPRALANDRRKSCHV
jgi:hypothetical protein